MPTVATGQNDLPLVFDGSRNFGGGVDAFRDPIELDADQAQYMLNVIVRDKLKARTRPGADAIGAGQTHTPTDSIQGALYFDTPTYEQLIVLSGGVPFYFDGTNWSVVAAWAEADAGSVFEGAQGVDKAYFTDGINNGKLWDGATFTDLADTNQSPPKGATIACWHAGRMWASGMASAPDTVNCSALLAFGPTDWDRTTRSFRVGGGEGDPITALASMQQFVLAVLKRNSVWLTVTDPRDIPANYSASQASDVVSSAIGCVGRKAWCNVGNDLLFLSDEGVFSLQRMLAAKDQWELSAPISQPVQPYIDRINPNYSYKATARQFKEFAFFSVPLDNSTTNNATLVYNWRLKKWCGVWDGWTPTVYAMTRFAGIRRLVFGDTTGKVNQWKEYADIGEDATYTDNMAGYATKLWSRSMTFGDLEAEKVGSTARVRFNRGNAVINMTANGSDLDLRTWTAPIAPTGDILGTDVLPFLLQTEQPTLAISSLRGLQSFNELFLKIESASGFWEIRNFTLGARVRPLRRK